MRMCQSGTTYRVATAPRLHKKRTTAYLVAQFPHCTPTHAIHEAYCLNGSICSSCGGSPQEFDPGLIAWFIQGNCSGCASGEYTALFGDFFLSYSFPAVPSFKADQGDPGSAKPPPPPPESPLAVILPLGPRASGHLFPQTPRLQGVCSRFDSSPYTVALQSGVPKHTHANPSAGTPHLGPQGDAPSPPAPFAGPPHPRNSLRVPG